MKLSDIQDPDVAHPFKHGDYELEIYSLESSVHTAYTTQLLRKRMITGQNGKEMTPLEEDELDRKGAAHLVKSWNLEDELTLENAMELFRKDRELYNAVYAEAHRLGKLSKKGSKSSSTGAKKGSGSGKKSTRKTPKASTGKRTSKG